MWPLVLTMLITFIVAVGVLLADILIWLPYLESLAHGMVNHDSPESFRTAVRGLGDSMFSPAMLISDAICAIDLVVFGVANFKLYARLFARLSS